MARLPFALLAAYRRLTQAPSLRGALGLGEAHMGLPAEFLIGTHGRFHVARYGRFVDDHWSLDKLLALHQLLYREMLSASGAPSRFMELDAGNPKPETVSLP